MAGETLLTKVPPLCSGLRHLVGIVTGATPKPVTAFLLAPALPELLNVACGGQAAGSRQADAAFARDERNHEVAQQIPRAEARKRSAGSGDARFTREVTLFADAVPAARAEFNRVDDLAPTAPGLPAHGLDLCLAGAATAFA